MSDRSIGYRLPGPPRSWKRADSNGKRRFESKGQSAEKTRIAWVARAAMAGATPMIGPVRVTVDCHARRKPTSVPDADNLAKLHLDALIGIAYRDDAQVTELLVRKHDVRAEGKDAAPYTLVTITPLGTT